MAPAIPSLPLTPFWQQERLLLVRAADAIRLGGEGGHEKLPLRQSLLYLSRARGSCTADARVFAAQARLLSVPLADCDDVMLFEELDKRIRAGTLVVVRAESTADEGASLARQRRAIRALGQTGQSRPRFEGATYRLVGDTDLGRLPDRDDYTVVSHAEAMRVLDGLAKTASPAQAKLLQEVRDQLAGDWRPPMPPDGIVLLKKTVALQGASEVEEPMERPRPESRVATETTPEEETCRPCAALREAKQAEALRKAAQDGSPFCAECGPPSAAVA